MLYKIYIIYMFCRYGKICTVIKLLLAALNVFIITAANTRVGAMNFNDEYLLLDFALRTHTHTTATSTRKQIGKTKQSVKLR